MSSIRRGFSGRIPPPRCIGGWPPWLFTPWTQSRLSSSRTTKAPPPQPAGGPLGGLVRLAAGDCLGVRACGVRRLDTRLPAGDGRRRDLRRGQAGHRVSHGRGPTDTERRLWWRYPHPGPGATPRLALRRRWLAPGRPDRVTQVPRRICFSGCECQHGQLRLRATLHPCVAREPIFLYLEPAGT